MKSKNSILLLTFPAGGPSQWAQNLQKELIKNGYETTLAAGKKEYLKQQFKYYDIVHSCVPMFNPFCKKFILTIHGNFKAEKHLSRFLFPIAIKRAHFITIPSEFLRNELHLDKALIIPNGIYPPQKIKKDYFLKNHQPTFGILTNFNFKPKADGLFNLAKIIQQTYPAGKLIIGGDGLFLKEYQKRLLQIHPNIEFIGHCKKEDLFEKIDIFTYYSFLDNQPLALLEAMAYGLPVISNSVGAIGEILTGELSSSLAKDDEIFKKTLQKLTKSQSLRATFGNNARQKTFKYHWDQTTTKFLALYEK
jgi:glycosyltransferase involved in cell wall biosynthesis